MIILLIKCTVLLSSSSSSGCLYVVHLMKIKFSVRAWSSDRGNSFVCAVLSLFSAEVNKRNLC